MVTSPFYCYNPDRKSKTFRSGHYDRVETRFRYGEHEKSKLHSGIPIGSDLQMVEVISRNFSFFFLNCMFYCIYFVLRIAVLPHSPGVVYYHLLLR